MKYYNFDEVQKTAKQNKGFVMGEHEAGRKHHELIRAVLNFINDELISSTSCATASVFKGDSDDREYVFIDIAYTVESDGAINDAECIFEALATDENINLANEILARIKEIYNIDIFPINQNGTNQTIDCISRGAIIEELKLKLKAMREMQLHSNAQVCERLISFVENFPSAEVIKHGCWMYGETENPFVVEIYCPWCGKPALYHEEDERPVESEFCPHCGTVMDAANADPSWPFYEMSLKQKLKKEKSL